MDIGKIEKIGDRELPGVPKFPETYPAPARQPDKAPSTPSPAPTKVPEKVPA